MSSTPLAGPLSGLRVVELSSEMGAWAGKLLAELGADVILVEPPTGDQTRLFGPFADDRPDPERSLWFWHYNTSKRGIVLDLESPEQRESLKRLLAGADILLEAERPGHLATLDLDYPALRRLNASLIMISITPFGQRGPRVDEEATDLTILAGGGSVWSCGYDDHSLPPVRGGGNQGYQTACHFAVMAGLSALLYRDVTGAGQHIDVNAHAASNVSTEAGSYAWLVAKQTVQRQTGRHASFLGSTQSTQVRCADGRYVSTGLGVRKPSDYEMLHEWLTTAGLIESFESRALLEWAIEEPIADRFSQDDASMAKRAAARDAIVHLAENMKAYDFFIGGQARDMQVSIIYSPEEVLGDPHMIARGFPRALHHPEIGREIIYPGAPYLFHRSPTQIQRHAPLLGEHTEEILNELLNQPAGHVP